MVYEKFQPDYPSALIRTPIPTYKKLIQLIKFTTMATKISSTELYGYDLIPHLTLRLNNHTN